MRFGATVTLAICAVGVAGGLMAHRHATADDGGVALASAPNARIEVPVMTPPPSGTPVGGDLSAVFEGEPSPESTVVPEQLTAVAAVVQVAPEPVARAAYVAPVVPAPVEAPPLPEPGVVASHATVYDAVAAAFPEQPDHAYAVVLCESSGHPGTNTGNGYYGLWQFDLATWQSVGGAGLPSQATVEEQVRRARMLYDRRGWQPWGCVPR